MPHHVGVAQLVVRLGCTHHHKTWPISFLPSIAEICCVNVLDLVRGCETSSAVIGPGLVLRSRLVGSDRIASFQATSG